MNFSQGHSGTKVPFVNRACFLRKNTRIHKKGEIHDLFVLALSLVWFAGATPDIKQSTREFAILSIQVLRDTKSIVAGPLRLKVDVLAFSLRRFPCFLVPVSFHFQKV